MPPHPRTRTAAGAAWPTPAAARTKPGLGEKTETYYEWWNYDLIARKLKDLRAERAEAKATVKREAVPRTLPDGRARVKPTPAERQVQKLRERITRLELLVAAFERGVERCASTARLAVNGALDATGVRLGPRRFHFKGRMRCVKVEYARMSRPEHKFEFGRRYPRNVPAVLHKGDESIGEADRLLAATAQGMPKDVRAFCLPFCHDLDISACHPSILACKAKAYGVPSPNLDWYVAHTDACRQRVMETHGVSKEHAKTLFTLLIYGGSYRHRLKKWRLRGAQAEPIKFVLRLETELEALRESVMAKPDLSERVRATMAIERTRKSNVDASRLKDEEEAKRSTWSQITQGWEDEALASIQRAVEGAGYVVHSLLFDGLQVYHDPSLDLQAAMAAAQARILQDTGMNLRLEEKPLFDQARCDAMV